MLEKTGDTGSFDRGPNFRRSSRRRLQPNVNDRERVPLTVSGECVAYILYIKSGLGLTFEC